MALLSKMLTSRKLSAAARTGLQDVARNSGVLLWLVLLAVDGRELSLRLSAQQLLKVTHYHYFLCFCIN
eukprot:11620-Heterococcus_DN1.PRE.1